MALSFPIAPMLAADSRSIPIGDEWSFEIKWDGFRTLAFVDDDHLRMQSRSGLDITDRYPELEGLATSVNASAAILDGELVALDDTGRPSFGALQRREAPVAFYAFDVLSIDGHDTIDLAYLDRRGLLEQLLEPGPRHLVPSYRIGGGAVLAEVTRSQGLEGIMAKHVDSRYVVGARSREWRKIKHRTQLEVVVGGYTTGTGARAATFGSLLVGAHDGDHLSFLGGIGTGFDDATLQLLAEQLHSLRTPDCPFQPMPDLKYCRVAHWVEPKIQIAVEMTELTNDGLIRHGSFTKITQQP